MLAENIEDFLDDNLDSIQQKEKKARDIAESLGDYDSILEKLRDEGILSDQIDRISQEVSIDFLTESDWEMLAVMELYDRATFEHCVNTYLIAKEKIEKILDGGVVISEIIKNEGVELDVFYRACLFHDIGKVNIPKFILNNSIKEGEWNNILCNLVNYSDDNAFKKAIRDILALESSEDINTDELKSALDKKHMRAMWFVPVSEVLSDDELDKLSSLGFSEEDSLRDIIQMHEEMSENILKNAGLFMEAKLAGMHHNYKQKPTDDLSASVESLSISVNLADILQLADIQEALQSGNRVYLDGFKTSDVLVELIKRVEGGYVDGYITYLWVKDVMDNLHIGGVSQKEMENLDKINNFLKKYKSND